MQHGATSEDIAEITRVGWLSAQPRLFRDEVIHRSVLQSYSAGKVIYRLGDPAGGIYGLVSGIMTVTAAPHAAAPRLIHVGAPGTWTGEGPFLSGEPRRLTLRALVPSRLVHLPLAAMEAMAARDPLAARRFGQIPMFSIDILLRAIHDLLIRDPDRRVAAVLLRISGGGQSVPLSQESIGDMACVSRKQMNYALRRFTERGWVTSGYRSVTLDNPAALSAFVAAADEV